MLLQCTAYRAVASLVSTTAALLACSELTSNYSVIIAAVTALMRYRRSHYNGDIPVSLSPVKYRLIDLNARDYRPTLKEKTEKATCTSSMWLFAVER